MTSSESRIESAFALRVEDLGRMPYAEALTTQRRLQQEVIAGRSTRDGAGGCMHLLLVEHVPPVITVSRRKGARTHLVATDEQLRTSGVTVAETDRGGDITYHGPGQIVVYPILDLNVLGLRLHSYMRFLEQIVIDTLAPFGIEGMRDPDATGVWVAPGAAPSAEVEAGAGTGNADAKNGAGAPRKICAMGVRVSRWVSMHGLALNVTTNLDHFDLIVPCGLAGRSVTSIERELGENCPGADAVRSALVDRFRSAVRDRHHVASSRSTEG